jgi:hypothetical protein
MQTPSSKKIDLQKDFAAGFYKSLQTRDTAVMLVFSTMLCELLRL